MLKHPTCSCVFVRVVLSKKEKWCLGALGIFRGRKNARGGFFRFGPSNVLSQPALFFFCSACVKC